MPTTTGSSITGLDMDGVAQLRRNMRLELSKPKQEQVRLQQSARRGGPLHVRQQPPQTGKSHARGGTAIRQSAIVGAGRGAVATSSSLSFPIKITDNLEDRTCTWNDMSYMYNLPTNV